MATKAKPENSTLGAILQRLDRIEDKLFGNGESILERVTRLEQKIEEYHHNREVALRQVAISIQTNIEGLLKEQVKRQKEENALIMRQIEEQRRQTLKQTIGTWVAIVGIIIGSIVSFVTLAMRSPEEDKQR